MQLRWNCHQRSLGLWSQAISGERFRVSFRLFTCFQRAEEGSFLKAFCNEVTKGKV